MQTKFYKRVVPSKCSVQIQLEVILKKTPTQVLPCKLCNIFKNSYFAEHLLSSFPQQLPTKKFSKIYQSLRFLSKKKKLFPCKTRKVYIWVFYSLIDFRNIHLEKQPSEVFYKKSCCSLQASNVIKNTGETGDSNTGAVHCTSVFSWILRNF